ncbi:MAG TPA: hypothetical protein VN963_11030 [bacterium]|nr:hypothetical protein [bacterium]
MPEIKKAYVIIMVEDLDNWFSSTRQMKSIFRFSSKTPDETYLYLMQVR